MPTALRRQAQDLCPHSADAVPFLSYSICYKDRIAKELNRLIVSRPDLKQADLDVYTTSGGAASSSAVPGGAAPQLPRQPVGIGIGARHGNMNRSSQFMGALGPSSWAASGGMKSTYQLSAGLMTKERQERQANVRDDLMHEIAVMDSAAAARGLAQQSAAAMQREAMRQRSESSLLRPGVVAIPSSQGPNVEPHAENRAPPQRCQSDNDLRRVAAANQLSAVRQRGEKTLIRIGKMTAGELETAKREGHGTLVALAGARGGSSTSSSRAAQLGRATMIALS